MIMINPNSITGPNKPEFTDPMAFIVATDLAQFRLCQLPNILIQGNELQTEQDKSVTQPHNKASKD